MGISLSTCRWLYCTFEKTHDLQTLVSMGVKFLPTYIALNWLCMVGFFPIFLRYGQTSKGAIFSTPSIPKKYIYGNFTAHTPMTGLYLWQNPWPSDSVFYGCQIFTNPHCTQLTVHGWFFPYCFTLWSNLERCNFYTPPTTPKNISIEISLPIHWQLDVTFDLYLKNPWLSDSGFYGCQISTTPHPTQLISLLIQPCQIFTWSFGFWKTVN